MKFACLVKAMLFGSVLMLPLGCGGVDGGGDDSDAKSAKDLSPEMQKEFEAYGESGRFGPDGQDKAGESGGGKAEDGKDKGGK